MFHTRWEKPLTARAAQLGIPVVSQPGFLSGLGDGFAEAFGGRADQLYAFRSWQQAIPPIVETHDAGVEAPLLVHAAVGFEWRLRGGDDLRHLLHLAAPIVQPQS